MSHPDEHVINLSVDAKNDADVIKIFEVLSRVGSSLALDGLDVRLNHFMVKQFCECPECERESAEGEDR